MTKTAFVEQVLASGWGQVHVWIGLRPGFTLQRWRLAVIASDEQWLTTVELFGAAALGGDWPTALNALAEVCGAERGQLIGVGADRAIPFNWMTRADEALFREFVEIRGGDPALNPRVAMGVRTPILQSWHDVRCCTDDELRRSFAYADFCRRWDIPYGSQATLLREDGVLIGLSVARTEAQGVPDAEDRRAFESLVRHVRAAVQTQILIEGQGAALMAGALESVNAAAFILDGRGMVRAITPGAEQAAGRGVLRWRGARLQAARDEDTRRLEYAIAAANAGRTNPAPPPACTLVLRDAAEALPPEVVDVLPLPSRFHTLGFDPRVLVVVRGGPTSDRRVPEVLRIAFGLSPSEADIALRMAEGESRHAIAAGRGVSIQTVRSQVKSLFAKLGVRSTAELTAKLNRLR